MFLVTFDGFNPKLDAVGRYLLWLISMTRPGSTQWDSHFLKDENFPKSILLSFATLYLSLCFYICVFINIYDIKCWANIPLHPLLSTLFHHIPCDCCHYLRRNLTGKNISPLKVRKKICIHFFFIHLFITFRF